MAAAIGTESSDDRHARERQVADCIKRLVARELVAITQPLRVEDARIANSDGIVERGTERHPCLPQPFNVLEEAEGARARHIAPIGGARKAEAQPLAPNHRTFEIDLDVEPQSLSEWHEFGESGPVLDPHLLQDLDKTSTRRQRRYASFLDSLDEK